MEKIPAETIGEVFTEMQAFDMGSACEKSKWGSNDGEGESQHEVKCKGRQCGFQSGETLM